MICETFWLSSVILLLFSLVTSLLFGNSDSKFTNMTSIHINCLYADCLWNGPKCRSSDLSYLDKSFFVCSSVSTIWNMPRARQLEKTRLITEIVIELTLRSRSSCLGESILVAPNGLDMQWTIVKKGWWYFYQVPGTKVCLVEWNSKAPIVLQHLEWHQIQSSHVMHWKMDFVSFGTVNEKANDVQREGKIFDIEWFRFNAG